ncbi:MAG: amidohydrolase family protein [Deltaproteobacteria bacterium]|nr:amidohydrolase family protein [Deltaproteobacteria bacterium]
MNIRYSILAGWMLDGSGGPVRGKVLLRVEDGIIVGMENCRRENMPDPEMVTDLSHCTILPPLVDSHAHLFMSGTTDKKMRQKQLGTDYEALKPVIGRHLNYLLSYGVLAVRDSGDRGGYALRYREEMDGNLPVEVKSAGRAWRQKDRYGTLIGRPPGENESLAASFDNESQNVDWVKLVNSGLNSLKVYGRETPPQFTLDEITGLVRAAERRGKKVMVHANGSLPVKLALEAGCHSIEHGFFMGRENLQLMAEKGIVWVPTVYTMKAYAENIDSKDENADLRVINRTLEHQLEQMSIARELGVTIALGTDAGSPGVLHGESVVEEMKLFKKAGFTLPEIVRCATYNGARLLGLDDIGLLQVGRAANFLVTRGTPAQLPRKLSYLEDIYLGGKSSGIYRKNPVKTIQ